MRGLALIICARPPGDLSLTCLKPSRGGETARPAGAFSEDLQARLFGISSQLTRSSRATMLWSEFCWNYSQQRLLCSQSLTLKGWVE